MIQTQYIDACGCPLSDEEASVLFREILAERLKIDASRLVTEWRRVPGPNECQNWLHVEIDGRKHLTEEETFTVLDLCSDMGFPGMKPVELA